MAALDQCYSPLKIIHHPDRIAALRQGLRTTPIHLQLILTNRCNHRCKFCAYRAAGYTSNQTFNDRDEIPFDKVLEIFDSCVALGIKAVELTGGGEPTIHPQFSEVCHALRTRRIDYAVVTNGSRLSSDDLIAMAGAKWVRFSIDAGTSQTYTTLRRTHPESFKRVQDNIRALVDMRSGPDPVVGVGFVVTRDNWHEVAQAAAQARDNGADNFRISAVFQNAGAAYFLNIYEAAKQECRAAESLSNGAFRVFNLFEERIDDLTQQAPADPTCLIQHLVSYIGADLNLYRCCILAYNAAGLLGSLKDRTLEDLWNSEEVSLKLRGFNATHCPRCMFHGKNRTIAYAIANNPPHANFL